MNKVVLNKPDWLAAQKVKKILAASCEKLGAEISADEIYLEHPVNPDHGDYASNLAMAKFDELKIKSEKLKVGSPLELAELIVKKLSSIINHQSLIIDRVEVVPPGFINFFLDKDFLLAQAEKFLHPDKFKRTLAEIGQGETMVIDYSSPNIAKPFGIGHLRSTNIGQAIYNLYEILGWRTIGDNHLGDWGTQFGKLIVAIKEWWDQDLKNLTIADLEKLYIKFHQQAEENPQLEDKAREWFKKLEQANKQAKKIWQVCVDISLKEFDRVYKLLGVDIDNAYGEAFYFFNGWMDKVIKDLEERELIRESQGAKVVEIDGFDTPAMIVKSDGATTYLTRDLATLKFRKEKWEPDLVVYEVGQEQKFHFKQVFKLSEKLAYISQENLIHVAHGLISSQEGKLSTRKGKSISLDQVLTQAIERAEKMIEKSKIDKDLSREEKEKIAKAVGIGAVKFNDLKQEPQKEIIFDWEQMLSLEGYAGPYLQYTYARAKSVLRKSEPAESQAIQAGRQFNNITIEQCNNEELALLRMFYQFPELLIAAAENFGPHHLCQYLFDLAQKFNLFYQKHRIIDPKPKAEGLKQEEIEKSRLFLTQVTADVLEMGLNLLGIEVLKKM